MTERFADQSFIEYKDRQNVTPYVVSEDIYILTQQWANRNGYVLPRPEFFIELRSDFTIYMKRIFPSFELVSEEEVSSGLKELVDSSGLYPVSLDRVYYPSQAKIDITRIVNSQGQDRGFGRRADSPLLLQQFRELRSLGLKEVALVDDVIFTGDLLKRVSSLLERTGIRVPIIFAGIGIGEGIKLLGNSGRQIQCVRTYPEVIDEICERDFYPGVPLSGRLVAERDNVGAPYILPFGNPGRWASIPEDWQQAFSRFCIGQSIKIFEEIEKASDREILCSNLDRKVISMPRDNTRFVTALRQLL